jgi:hypothetical protein
MGSSFTLEDPFRATQYDGMKTMEKAKLVFKDMGKGMWRQGKGFGMVGALYAGTECVVEGVSRCSPKPRGLRQRADFLSPTVPSKERHLQLGLRWLDLGRCSWTEFWY